MAIATTILPLIPIAYLLIRAGGAGIDAWRTTLDTGLIGISIRSMVLALLVAAGTIVIAVPYAFLVVRSDLPGRRVWGVVGALPLVIPSYVGAFALLGAFGPRGMLQQLLAPLGVERLPEVYGFWGACVILILFT
ncbi:MAG: iron ABC transporter permease, partial [Gaiellales bacterium]